MAIKSFENKIKIVNFLIFLRGKLQSLRFVLEDKGLNPQKAIAQEKELAKIIEQLHVNLYDSWNGQVTGVIGDLRGINNLAQKKVRELQSTVEKAKKVLEIAKIVDQGIKIAAGLM